MGFMRVQHVLNAVNALPEDQIVNTFHFVGPGTVDAASGAAVAQLVNDFWNDENTGVGVVRLSSLIGQNALATGAHTCKVYNMEQGKPRVPVYVNTQPFSVANQENPLPHEVACCLSYRAAPQSGRKAERSRGRIFIGPMTQDSQDFDPITHVSRPSVQLQNTLLAAALRTFADTQAAGWTWQVFSPTTLAGNLPNGGNFGCVEIDEFLVDNAWDTIRSRGPRASGRLTALVA